MGPPEAAHVRRHPRGLGGGQDSPADRPGEEGAAVNRCWGSSCTRKPARRAMQHWGKAPHEQICKQLERLQSCPTRSPSLPRKMLTRFATPSRWTATSRRTTSTSYRGSRRRPTASPRTVASVRSPGRASSPLLGTSSALRRDDPALHARGEGRGGGRHRRAQRAPSQRRGGRLEGRRSCCEVPPCLDRSLADSSHHLTRPGRWGLRARPASAVSSWRRAMNERFVLWFTWLYYDVNSRITKQTHSYYTRSCDSRALGVGIGRNGIQP